MKLNDEEQDMLAGKSGPLPQEALRHQKAVGEFFGAADFVPVTQAHIMADTESLGEAGVRWLERLASTAEGQKRVRVPTITDPRGTDFAKADSLGQTAGDARSGAARHRGFRQARRHDDRHLHQLSDDPGADGAGACRVRRHRGGHLFELGVRSALQFRGRPLGALRRSDRTNPALWLSSSRAPPRDLACSRGLHARHAQRMGCAGRRDRASCRQLLGGAGDRGN